MTGCVSFRETHLFRDNTPNVPNYYKVNIKGSTFFSKTRYVSGYFDEAAVLEYFGEFSQPDSSIADYLTSVKRPESSSNNSTSDVKLTGEIEGKRLVMILSSNSKAVADQIGALAENQQLMDALTSMATQEKELERLRLQDDLRHNKELSDRIVRNIGLDLIKVNDTADFETNQVHLTNSVNSLLDALDYRLTIDSLAELEKIIPVLK